MGTKLTAMYSVWLLVVRVLSLPDLARPYGMLGSGELPHLLNQNSIPFRIRRFRLHLSVHPLSTITEVGDILGLYVYSLA
jgi:hypothetical protein